MDFKPYPFFPHFSKEEEEMMRQKQWIYNATFFCWTLPKKLPLNNGELKIKYSSFPRPHFRSYISYPDFTTELLSTDCDNLILAVRDAIDKFMDVFSRKASEYMRNEECYIRLRNAFQEFRP